MKYQYQCTIIETCAWCKLHCVCVCKINLHCLFYHTVGNDFRIDGGSSQLTIDFEKTQSSTNVSVTILGDDIGEGDELIILNLETDGPNNINVGSINDTTVITIDEDDCEFRL